MSILLESDANTPVQSHFDELTFRTTVVFLSVSLLSLAWLFVIDSVLANLLDHLQPCPDACLNVYEPAEWSVVRWLTAIVLGMLSALPLMVHHFLRFAKPGLLPGEYRALRRWTWGGTAGVALLSAGLLGWLFPWAYDAGHRHHLSVNLVAQYNAVDILLYAVLSVWMLMLFTFTWLSLVFLGKGGILNQQTAEFWRWRIYGLGTLLLLLSVPEHNTGLGLVLLLLYWSSSELIGSRWFTMVPSHFGISKTRLDHEGRKRRILIADCSCLGANAHYGVNPIEGYSMMRFGGICSSKTDRNQLMEHVLSNRISDVIITGCDTAPCPKRLKNNFNTLGTSLRGFDLMGLQNHRPGMPLRPQLDVEMSLVSLNDPFPEHGMPQRLIHLMKENSILPEEILLRENGPLGWSSFERDDVLLLRIEPESKQWSPLASLLLAPA